MASLNRRERVDEEGQENKTKHTHTSELFGS